MNTVARDVMDESRAKQWDVARHKRRVEISYDAVHATKWKVEGGNFSRVWGGFAG